MLRIILRVAAIFGLLFTLLPTTVFAQAKPVRVRGTIERVDGDVYVIKARDGSELKLKLAEGATVAAVVPMTMADIKQGSYVGIATLPEADGSQKALEVLVFPEAMRGAGEGHYPHDLQPTSMMTNGNVDQAVVANDGKVLTVKYKDGEKKIIVPPNIPIVTFAPGEKSELKPNAIIFVGGATPLPDGILQASRITVGRGIAPPM
jgi:hypothetical protein